MSGGQTGVDRAALEAALAFGPPLRRVVPPGSHRRGRPDRPPLPAPGDAVVQLPPAHRVERARLRRHARLHPGPTPRRHRAHGHPRSAARPPLSFWISPPTRTRPRRHGGRRPTTSPPSTWPAPGRASNRGSRPRPGRFWRGPCPWSAERGQGIAEYELQPLIEPRHHRAGETPGPFLKSTAVGRRELRDVGDRAVPEPGVSRTAGDVAGCVRPLQCPREWDQQHRCDLTPVQRVRLHDHRRPAVARLRSRRECRDPPTRSHLGVCRGASPLLPADDLQPEALPLGLSRRSRSARARRPSAP